MADSNDKNYPLASTEIARMMGISGGAQGSQTGPVGTGPVSNLPVVEAEHAADEHGGDKPPHKAHTLHQHLDELVDPPFATPIKRLAIADMLRIVGPYILFFAVGIFLYLFFFSNINFSGWFKFSSPQQSPKQTALTQLQEKNLDSYYAWVRGFYFDVSDPAVTDPNADNSGNGLTNFQKYLLNLNPKSYDTLGLGMADSEALAKGVNPTSGAALTDRQKEIVEKYFDLEVIMNKLTLSRLGKNGSVAGTNVYASGQLENANPILNVLNANELEINTDIPGRLEIPRINVNVPIMWSKDPTDFDRDLRSGVVHYPGTALPGQIGTSYISGHSSNFAWAKGEFNKVFSRLNELPDGSSFKITVVQKNGRDAILHFVVNGKKEYTATDQSQFANQGKAVVALSTCWPINTTQRRLVVYGELTQVEK